MTPTGPTVIVTGAARGLGRAIAETFGHAGARVALIDVLESVRETASALSKNGIHAIPIVADTTDPSQVDTMVQTVIAELGDIDVLINNAGTFSVVAPVWEADPDKWFRDIRTNLYGSFLCCRAVAKHMVKRQSGYIINIVSSGGVGDPHPYSTSYASSKTGLMRLTEGLAQEAKPHNVKVFAVGPPAIRTQMTEFLMGDPEAQKWRPTFGKIFEENRDSPPERIADFILKLTNGQADTLTGRFFNPRLAFEDYVQNADRIILEDLWTLRITRPHPPAPSPTRGRGGVS